MPFFSKLLIFFLGLAVFAVVAAWIMGGASSKSSTRISIEASPTDVFRYLTDGEKIPQWAKDVVSAPTYTDDEQAGSIERVVSTVGKEGTWEDSIMRFKVGEAISIQSKKDGLTNVYVFQLERNDLGGTNVEYRMTQSASGLNQFSFAFEDRENVRTEMGTEMTKLKQLVESEVDFDPDAEPEDLSLIHI